VAYTPPTNITTTVSAVVNVTASETVAGLPNTIGGVPQAVQNQLTYLKGVAASQCDTVGIFSGTIAPSATKSIFLSTATPTLTDFIGQPGVIFARVKFLYIYLSNAGTPASSISWGSTGTDPFLMGLTGTTPLDTINAGGGILRWDMTATGHAITVSTNDHLNILNNDASNTAAITVVVGGGAT
jgi:hypothetical protein